MEIRVDGLKLAWLAGVIDGEGSIGAYTVKTSQKKPDGAKYDSVHVVYQLEISNNNTLIIEESHKIIRAVLGDSLPLTAVQVVLDNRPSRLNSKINYRVNVKDHRGLIRILSTIEPYLVGKKSQAQVMLHLLKTHRRHTQYTKVELEVIEVLKKLKHANMVTGDGNTEPSRSEQSLRACVETLQGQLL